MSAAWIAVALLGALAGVVVAGGGGGGAARFGDRLAPRVPAPYAPRAAAAQARHYAEYEDVYDLDDEEPSAEDEAVVVEEPEPKPIPLPPPRRPARTEAHRLEMSTEYFILPERTTAPTPPAAPTSTRVNVVLISRETSTPTSIPIYYPIGALRAEPWAVPVLALSCVCMVSIAGFEAFVVWGARNTAPSRRHLLLGQALLLGLFACAASAGLFAVRPTPLSCGAVRFGTGVAYVLVFASLLVKCVFLLSLNGGVYLPAAYQALLLFFAVLIQVAIGAQWVGGGGARCDAPLLELLLSLSYAACLVAAVCGVALRSRAIRDNYREATHIACAAAATAVIWMGWVAAALAAPERHRDACVAAGLLTTCALVFMLMFAPKGRRLAALGRGGRWDADRDEGLSSLGAGGSGYSPSFFHFKPVKYGMVSTAAPLPAPPPQLDRKEPPAQPAG